MPHKIPLLLLVFPAYQAWDLYQLVTSGPTYHALTEAAATLAFLVRGAKWSCAATAHGWHGSTSCLATDWWWR